jgi:hypothetical protein
MIVGNDRDNRRLRRSGDRRRKEGYEGKVNFFHFVIFQNYDGSSTSKTIPRTLYKKLFPDNV